MLVSVAREFRRKGVCSVVQRVTVGNERGSTSIPGGQVRLALVAAGPVDPQAAVEYGTLLLIVNPGRVEDGVGHVAVR
jgi:hypothetical protein